MQKGSENKQQTSHPSTAATGQKNNNVPDAIQMPSISIPKGGGAITGMGEKFQVNPATGTGGMTIPIAMSPGRNGFAPQLALNYDSGAGNTPFGLGWNIGLASISRKTSKGLPTYIDSEDVFLLAGAEDLVPVPFKKDDQRIDDDDYIIHRFQPRIEGLFARIEKWTNKADKTCHWRVITKDNVTSIYGKGDNANPSKIVHPEDDTKVFQWFLERTFDDKGNIIIYEYKKEDGIHLPNTSFEQRRIANNQVYLKRVLYGNTKPYKDDDEIQKEPDFDAWNAANPWLFHLVFDYGEHKMNNKTPAYEPFHDWATRDDIFSTFRAGFDIRTYRLCKAIHCFHGMNEDGELIVAPEDYIPVKSTCFSQEENAIATQIQSIQHCFYYKGKYADLPPVEFCYTEAVPNHEVQKITDHTTLENLPQGIDGQNYTWIDLYGEGISGILNRMNEGWYYKANEGNGYLAPKQLLKEIPSLAVNSRAQLADIDGDGMTNLLVRENGLNGYYEINHDDKWDHFQSFKDIAAVDWGDPNLRMLDLNGDGFTDILITDDNCFVWHPSKGKDGHDTAIRVAKALDEENGPRVAFSDAEQTIFLSDMSGDGLTDIVRIRNGSVCYWANLGYGHFSAKIVMNHAPRFDHPDYFAPSRIRLADIDGSGTTDILYLGRDKISFWHNQSGNSFGEEQNVAAFPAGSKLHAVNVFDFKGSGTACLVWSSPLPQDAASPLRYIDLMGNKPYLLCEVKNNMGAVTKMSYASSTKFYLADKKEGKPWISKLPFPVQVLDRVETYDEISKNHFVSTYAYHHGYFDGIEREFRGFGMVEQWDTEDYALLKENTLFGTIGKNWKGENREQLTSDSPPIYTKTWFHTGFFDRGSEISGQYKNEYYQGGDAHWLLEDSLLPRGLPGEETREAARAMKGSMLRQEVYSMDKLDKAAIPYVVTESNYKVKLLQEKGDNKHAIFLTTQQESLSYHYERDAADPRIAQTANLMVDDFGNVTYAISIVYPRRGVAVIPEQKKLYVTLTENRLIHATHAADWYRHSHLQESRTFEIRHLGSGADKFEFIELFELVFDSDNNDELKDLVVDYAAIDSGNLDFRLLNHSRATYFEDDVVLNKQAAFGTLPSLAIPYETYTLVFTEGILAQEDEGTTLKPDNAFLENNKTALGYKTGEDLLFDDDNNKKTDWWHVPGRPVFDAGAAERFYLPQIVQDPFDNPHQSEFDKHSLFVKTTKDALGNQSVAVHNYHFMQAQKLIDPNGTSSEVQFDVRGMVVASTVSGKRGEGDRATAIDLGVISAESGRDYLEDMVDNPIDYLDTNTTYFYYDVWAWKNRNQPAYAIGLSRETHVSVNSGTTNVQITISYSDGFGRERLTKVQAEDGMAPRWDSINKTYVKDGEGNILNETTTNRWVANGAVIFNNKGKPVKQYEPFFDSHPFYIDDELLTQQGVSPTIHYDPMDRVIRTDMPDGTYTKVEFTSWEQKTFDQNDTVLDSEWYQNIDQTSTTAEKAAVQDNTPTTQYLDTLGRPIVSIAHNKYQSFHRTNIIEEEQYISTRTELNIEGQPIKITDARDNPVMRYRYAMNGLQLYQNSMDAGKRWALVNVMGNPAFTWDEREHVIKTEYDALQRPTHQWENEKLRERIYYGEEMLTDNNTLRNLWRNILTFFGINTSLEDMNLRGQAYLHFDGAGVIFTEGFDFKGHPLKIDRRLHKLNYSNLNAEGVVPDWTAVNAFPAQTALNQARNILENEAFESSSLLDALDRPIERTAPDGSKQYFSYNKAGLLETVETSIKTGNKKTYVENIDYNAKGQRVRIRYGNGVSTRYKYDVKTFRLSQLLSTKNGNDTLQDISYTYDPVGNITQLYDAAQETVFRNNKSIKPKHEYTYDGLYRLREASGRERRTNAPPSHLDIPQMPLASASDSELRTYRQYYTYDSVGNIEVVQHIARQGSWTRTYTYEDKNNRLVSDAIGGTTHDYTYDEYGSMTKMGHLDKLHWDYKDQLIHTNISDQQNLYCTYDTSRQRVRKIYKTANNIKERIYLGDYEIYRLRSANGARVNQQIDTLHIMDDQQRICLIETRTINASTPLTNAEQQTAEHQKTRYQLNNHLGSACIELSETAEVISYEEYYPYGSSSYRAQKGGLEGNPKRYRYSSKERDESTGLYYYGARYYASWLGRWCSADPAGLVDGGNLYGFVQGNPVIYIDDNGKELTDAQKKFMKISEGNKKSFAVEAGKLKEKLAENFYDSAEQAQQVATQAQYELDALDEVGFWESLNPFVGIPNKYREVSARTRLSRAKYDLTPVEYRIGNFSYAPVIGAIAEGVANLSTEAIGGALLNVVPKGKPVSLIIKETGGEAIEGITKKTARRVQKQSKDYTCVAASCKMVLEDIGRYFPENSIAKVLSTTIDGASILDIGKALRRLDIIGKKRAITAVHSHSNGTIENLSKALSRGDKLIASIKMPKGDFHAIVIDEISNGMVHFRDPLEGIAKSITVNDFKFKFTGRFASFALK